MSKKNRGSVASRSVVVTPDDVIDAAISGEPMPIVGDPITSEDAAPAVSMAMALIARPAPSTNEPLTVKGFTFTRESGDVTLSHPLLVKALERVADRLAENDYAAAILEFTTMTGSFSWIIDYQLSDTGRTRRATVGLSNAIMRLAFMGKIAPMQFMAVTIPTRTIGGVKIISGTRLFKLA